MPDATATFREYLESWNRRDFTRMRELMHPSYTYTGGDGQQQRGPDAGLAVARMFADAFPDGRIDIQRTYAAGDTVVTEFTGRGTHRGELMGVAPSNKQVTIPVCNVSEIRDGKIYAEREYIDMLHLMRQIGAAPSTG